MTSRGAAPSSSNYPGVLAQLPPSTAPMDADASAAAAEAATRKRAASAPPEPVSGSGGPTHVASSVLVAAYQPAQKAFNAEVQQQARLYASALSKQHAHAAKLRSLRSMKEAGQLPKNLQFPVPRIYGEGMVEEVEAIAAAALKEAGHKILDAIVVAQQAQTMRATAAASELAEAAPAKVQAVMFTLPATWRVHPVVTTMQQAALENLAFALQRAKDTQEASASKRQQQAEEKAAAAERAAAERAPLSIEQQMQKIAEEVVSKRLQQQQHKQQQRPPRPRQQRPGSSPAQPARPGNPRRRQEQQQQPPQQGRSPGAAAAQPAAPQGAPVGPNRGRQQQQQQQGAQRPPKPRQPSGDPAGRRGTWADRVRPPASGPRNAPQRFQRRHQQA